jgi:hypothetical protein
MNEEQLIMTNPKIKLNITTLFDDTGVTVEFTNTYTLKLKTHDEFSSFCTKLHQLGVMQYMIKRFGSITYSTDMSGRYSIVEEFMLYTPMTRESFDEMCTKWEAVLKQHDAI